MSLLGPRLKHDRCFDELLRQLAEDPILAPVAVGLFEALPHDVARRFFAELVREPPPEAAAIVADNVAEADSLFSVREQAAALIQLAEQNTGNTAIVILNNFTGRGHGRRPVEAEAGEFVRKTPFDDWQIPTVEESLETHSDPENAQEPLPEGRYSNVIELPDCLAHRFVRCFAAHYPDAVATGPVASMFPYERVAEIDRECLWRVWARTVERAVAGEVHDRYMSIALGGLERVVRGGSAPSDAGVQIADWLLKVHGASWLSRSRAVLISALALVLEEAPDQRASLGVLAQPPGDPTLLNAILTKLWDGPAYGDAVAAILASDSDVGLTVLMPSRPFQDDPRWLAQVSESLRALSEEHPSTSVRIFAREGAILAAHQASRAEVQRFFDVHGYLP